jgi:hypothetical protein
MPLNFPANPSNGDEHEGYVYDGTNGVWNRKAAQRAYTVSPAKPTSPIDGDVWFSEIDGATYVYYVDEDSSQWIEIGGTVGAQGGQGPQGEVGATGETGAAGPQGDPGPGVAIGGTTGQALVKSSNDDYDTEWADRATTGKAIAMSIVFG